MLFLKGLGILSEEPGGVLLTVEVNGGE